MEQLVLAEQSSDLSDVMGQITDVDLLRAAGMVGQHHPLAFAVWRLTENHEAKSAREAFDLMVTWLLRHGHDSDPVHTAATVLDWMAHPVCPVCRGRCFETIAGTPTLTDKACNDCAGTGKRPRAWSDGARDVYEHVQSEMRQAAAAIIRKLRRD